MKEYSNILTSQIVRNPSGLSVFHPEFDNFDIFINTMEVQSSTHTAHWIMIQEISDEDEPRQIPLKETPVERSRAVRLDIDEEPLPECYMAAGKNPSYHSTETTIIGGKEAFENA